MKLSAFAFLFSITLMPQLFAALGPSVGGGGDVVILPDDSIVLADPWINTNATQPNNMPPIRSLSPELLSGVASYANVVAPLLKRLSLPQTSEISSLLQTLSKRNNDLKFYGVKDSSELNSFCASGGRKVYALPNGYTVEQIACTAGNDTFFVEPIFARLDLREQILLLVHERLTTLRDSFGGKNYAAIAKLTTGLRLYLDLYKEQGLEHFRLLSKEEQNKLTAFYSGIQELEKRNQEVDNNSFKWAAHIFGGGLVHSEAKVDPSALIGLDCFIPEGSRVEAGAKIVHFLSNGLSFPLFIGKNAEISNTVINTFRDSIAAKAQLTLAENAKVTNSSFKNFGYGYNFGENSLLNNSKIVALLFSTDDHSIISDSFISAQKIKFGKNVEIISSSIQIKDRDAQVADSEKLNDKGVFFTEDDFFPLGVVVKPYFAQLNFAELTCEECINSSGPFTLTSMDTGDGIVIQGVAKKLGLFKKGYKLSNVTVTARVNFKQVSAEDKSLMINSAGHFVKRGYRKQRIQITIPAYSSLYNYTGITGVIRDALLNNSNRVQIEVGDPTLRIINVMPSI